MCRSVTGSSSGESLFPSLVCCGLQNAGHQSVRAISIIPLPSRRKKTLITVREGCLIFSACKKFMD